MIQITEILKSAFEENGVISIDSSVDSTAAENAREAFLAADYDEISQTRRRYYSEVFEAKSALLPDGDEVYSSKFWRSRYLEGSDPIRTVVDDEILPIVEALTGYSIKSKDLRAYKMSKGGHFRIHQDAYAGKVGFIWYLSKGWKIDWGGLLITQGEDGPPTVVIPRWNQLVIMDHKYGRVPHTVTHVTEFAKEARMMLVGFLD